MKEKAENNKRDHYEIEGENYDSVTTVINYFVHPNLAEWRAKVGNREANKIMKDAQEIGLAVEDYIEEDFKTGEFQLSKEHAKNEGIANCVNAYKLWKKDYQSVVFYDMQKQVNSRELMVAGTLDILAKRGDSKGIIDIKCSGKISVGYKIQVNAYAHMLGNIDWVAILRLDKKLGEYDWWECPINALYVEAFKGRLLNYRLERGEYGDKTTV